MRFFPSLRRASLLCTIPLLVTPPAQADGLVLRNLMNEMQHVNLLDRVEHLESFGTRFTGSRQAAQVRDYLYAELEEMGWQVIIQEFALKEPVFGQTVSWNIIARRPGTSPDGKVIICAHWDSIDENGGGSWVDPENPAPGANDNATGVAILLEIAGITRNLSFRRDVEIVLFGAEESGLQGSRHYVDGLRQVDANVIGVFNIDSVGYDVWGARDFHIFYNRSNDRLKRLVVQWAREYTELTPVSILEPEGILDCDAHHFLNAGYPGLSLWEGEDHAPWYNHKLDTIERNHLRWHTNYTFFESMGRLSLLCFCKLATD
ncbi:MAG: M20/M25/M40 family metallo-hydrolase [bacterium]|nr:M20/M25/M40 family metallo-hydrolase [bacterium]